MGQREEWRDLIERLRKRAEACDIVGVDAELMLEAAEAIDNLLVIDELHDYPEG